jgi:hypothetical protein
LHARHSQNTATRSAAEHATFPTHAINAVVGVLMVTTMSSSDRFLGSLLAAEELPQLGFGSFFDLNFFSPFAITSLS